MFSCDICGDCGLAEYEVTYLDMSNAELCHDCMEMEQGKLLMSQRFVGLTPTVGENK